MERRIQTMRGQRVVNRIMRGMLRTPFICRGLGRRLITVYVVGRKTGRRYAVPVAYTRDKASLLIGTPFGWARNLRTGEPVDVRYMGRRRSAEVRLVTDEPSVVEAYGIMAGDNHAFAKFNKIGLDEAGNPDPDDLHLAWADGARAAWLTLR
jgi:deazaflavin-dependent oxidoreductase (nitroreductase family)